ncbi:MAG: hypothetical protein ACJASQ_002777 [Crocinitomicaceae bacterium]|jgi:hypothetical protein
MRPELTQYELVESYISGSMTQAEAKAFEVQIAISPELQSMVEFQPLFAQASKRSALRAEIAAIIPPPPRKPWKGKWTIGGIFLVLITTASFFLMNSFADKPVTTADETKLPTEQIVVVPDTVKEIAVVEPAYLADTECEVKHPVATKVQPKEEEKEEVLSTWIPLDIQHTPVKVRKGATVLGDDGTLVIIPSDAFIDKNGKPVHGEVDFQLVEALKWEDMIAYNLTTVSGKKALETGGMLRAQAFQNGEEVQINPKRPLYIEIPTDDYNPDMVSWEGEVKDGDINWKKPTELKRYLTKVDLALLDFLPQGFDNEVEGSLPDKDYSLPFDDLVDSIYYSLSGFKEIEDVPKRDVTASKKRRTFTKRVIVEEENYQFIKSNRCHIDPLSIKTIRDSKFQETFIATKEFEERLQVLHTIRKGESLLRLYIANIDKNMSFTDGAISTLLNGEEKERFEQFAAENATNIEDHIYDEQLEAFYNQQRAQYKMEVDRIERTYYSKSLNEISELKNKLRAESNEAGVERYRPLTAKATVANSSAYTTTWFSSSWLNIDCYIHLLQAATPVTVDISASDNLGHTRIYQSIPYMNTVLPLNYNDGKAKALFPNKSVANQSVFGTVFCAGIQKKSGLINFASTTYNPYKTRSVALVWNEVSEDELYEKLKKVSPYNHEGIIKDLENDKEILDAIIARKNRIETFNKEIEKLEDKMEERNAFMNALLDYIDICKPIDCDEEIIISKQ